MAEDDIKLTPSEIRRNAAIRSAINEAVKEWLDSIFITFGRWSLTAIGAAVLVGMLYLALIGSGWRKG
jgi:hypothetical protein